MDWFGPTGALLREAGAKPAIPLMVLASIVIFGARYGRIVTSLPVGAWFAGFSESSHAASWHSS
jgi:hypothetical protein